MRRLSYIFAFLALLAWPDQKANADAGITLKYTVAPASEAKSLSVFSRFYSMELANTFSEHSQTVTILPDLDVNQPVQVTVEWSGNRMTSFPVFILPIFSGEIVEMSFLQKPIINGEIGKLLSQYCHGRLPGNAKFAFNSIFICSKASKWLEDNGYKWTEKYFKAVNGWFTANNWLYRLKHKKANFSPYGFDQDLIHVLQQVKVWEAAGRGRRKVMFPLVLPDIEIALKAHNEEKVRLVGVIPGLIGMKQFSAAKSVNDAATKAYGELSEGNSLTVIDGVNGALLQGNADYIQNLLVGS